MDTIHAYVDRMTESIRCNALEWQTLNDTAWRLGQIHEAEGDEEALRRGVRYAERAARLIDPCAPTDEDRGNTSLVYDTLRYLHEVGGEPDLALEYAVRARDVLPHGHPRFARRQETVERLREAASTPR
jgi:hypothetical protein